MPKGYLGFISKQNDHHQFSNYKPMFIVYLACVSIVTSTYISFHEKMITILSEM